MRRIGRVGAVGWGGNEPSREVVPDTGRWFTGSHELNRAAVNYLDAARRLAVEYAPHKTDLGFYAEDLPGYLSYYKGAEKSYDSLLPGDVYGYARYKARFGQEGWQVREEQANFESQLGPVNEQMDWRSDIRHGIHLPSINPKRKSKGGQTANVLAESDVDKLSQFAPPAPSAPPTSFRWGPGTFNADAKKVQEALIAKGHLPVGSADGYYGPKTSAAVAAFQRSVSLPQTGMGPITWKALFGESSTSGLGPGAQVIGAVAGAVLGYNYGSKGMSKEASAIIGGVGGLLLGRWLGG